MASLLSMSSISNLDTNFAKINAHIAEMDIKHQVREVSLKKCTSLVFAAIGFFFLFCAVFGVLLSLYGGSALSKFSIMFGINLLSPAYMFFRFAINEFKDYRQAQQKLMMMYLER